MSFNEVLRELPTLTLEQRQVLVRRAIELDEPTLTPAEESLVEERRAAHYRHPDSSLPLEPMKARLRKRFSR